MVKDRDTQTEAISTDARRVDIAGSVAALLAYAGAAVAGTVWWADRVNADLPCISGGGCEQVASSSYAHVHPFGLDLPVALIGLAGYLFLYALSTLRLAVDKPALKRTLAIASTVVAGIGALYSWFLQYIAHFKLGAFCPWCFTSACLMTALLASGVVLLTRSKGVPQVNDPQIPGKRERKALAERRKRSVIVSLAPLLALPLIALKLADHPKSAPPAAPTFGQTAAVPPPGTPSSTPTYISIDFPTWVRILQHTDSSPRGAMRVPYTVVEFGDFQCPTCAKARTQIEEVVDHSKVNMFFINFPLSEHKFAVPAAEAAFAAAAQGKFWPMYDALYTHQDDLNPSRYAEYADKAGIDGRKLAADVESQKYMPNVQTSEQFCNQIKVTATPTLVVHNNLTGDSAVAVGLDQIQTALIGTDWHAYDNVDMAHMGQTSSKSTSKKRSHS